MEASLYLKFITFDEEKYGQRYWKGIEFLWARTALDGAQVNENANFVDKEMI